MAARLARAVIVSLGVAQDTRSQSASARSSAATASSVCPDWKYATARCSRAVTVSAWTGPTVFSDWVSAP